jgi:hypothetical protein
MASLVTFTSISLFSVHLVHAPPSLVVARFAQALHDGGMDPIYALLSVWLV